MGEYICMCVYMWMNGLRLLWPVVLVAVVPCAALHSAANQPTHVPTHTRSPPPKKTNNRRLLNALVRQQPSLLERTLAPLVLLPQCRGCLDFDNKKAYFRAQVHK